MSLSDYCDKFGRLIVNTQNGRASPHKICMLLAVLDLARAGALKENRIAYAPPLLERYRRFFDAVRAQGDHPNPYFPFFYLRGRLLGGTPSFWHLEPLPGREAMFAAMTRVGSAADIAANIAWASLDSELHTLLQSQEAIDALGETLAERWFGRGLQELGAVAERSAQISRYECGLRSGSGAITLGEPPPPSYVRDPAFRRVVIEGYDYRCAATGVRVLLPSGEAMVEAAHIHPFSEAGDDDPRNGIALSPDMHWAMDRNLIAPGPDFRWRVSRLLDERIPDYRSLCGLEGSPLLLPAEARLYPKRTALEWRIERLRDPDWSAGESLVT